MAGFPVFMSAIKDPTYKMTLDKERYMCFSLHVLEAMQEKFGELDKLADAMQGKDAIKNAIWILTIALNEGALYKHYLDTGSMEGAEEITERVAALILSGANMADIRTAIFQGMAHSMRGTTEPPEDTGDDEKEGNTKPGEV